jgi:hypothetical protein
VARSGRDVPEGPPPPGRRGGRAECDGGVPTWQASGGEVNCFVLDWDVLDAGSEHDTPPAEFRAVEAWRETFEEFDRKREEGGEGD